MMLETAILPKGTGQRGPETLIPEIKIAEAGDAYGKFLIEPLERGYGITIGNPMRRMLLSSVDGTAITWVKIDGILHEYSIIPHMKEEVMEFLINVKGIRIRSVTGRPGKMRLEIREAGRVCAGDIATSADFEIVNPEMHLVTLDSEDASISMEFNVDHGKGYQPAPQGDGLPGPLMGVLPVDAIFNPVRKVNYSIERTRVGHVTDYERLVLEVWTDSTITPVEALRKSSQVLVNHFFIFNSLGHEVSTGPDRPPISVSPEVYQTPIEKLELTPRTLNCLKRARITKVGQVLEMSNEELLKIRNFGEKSLEELLGKLESEGLISEGERAKREGAAAEDLETDGMLEVSGTENGTGPGSEEDRLFMRSEDADTSDDDDDDEETFDDDYEGQPSKPRNREVPAQDEEEE